jgi:hypothetical protein
VYKFFFALALLVGSVAVHAEDKLDGCGLGWQVTQGKTYTATTTRGTTNAFIPPTFGMTTGTMGCDKLDIGAQDREAADYVASNYEQLKSEIAMGRGEYVDGMASAFGCKALANEIGAQLQKNYDTVVAPAQNSLELYKNIRTQIAGVCI